MSDAPTPTNNIDDSESHIQYQWWGFNLLIQFFNRWWGFNRSNPDKTKDTISLLGNSRGAINGGEFTAIGGNQIRVEVNVNASDPKVSRRHPTLPIASDATDIDTECMQDVETTGSHVSPPNFHENLVTQREPSMFLQQQLNKAPYTMYFRCLATRERGSPLWIPEPNRQLPVEYQRNGLVIGDVGIITEQGCFDSLFNITLPPDHPLAINSDDLPQSFSPLEIKPSQILKFAQFKKGTSLSSGSVSVTADNSSSGLTFESSASEGAILTLPDGSNSEDLRNKKKLREYLALHLEEIYRCALIEHGREIKNGDLRVVTGFDKTTSWGMAAFLNSTSQRKPSFRLEFQPRHQGCPGRAHTWMSSGTAEVKAGPDTREVTALRMGDPSQQDVEYENQTVFVRTENPTLNSVIWDALLNESGLADLELDDKSNPPQDESVFRNNPSLGSGNSTGRGGGQSAAQGSSSCGSSNTLAFHPSNGINNMLLEANPSARMVITGDDIWISVLHEDDHILPSIETLYTRIMNSYIVHLEDGVIFLEKVDAESPVNGEREINAPQQQLESESNTTPYDETEAGSATQMDEAVSAEAPGGDTEFVLGVLPDIEVKTDTEREKNNSDVKKLVEPKPESPVIPEGQIPPNIEGTPKPPSQQPSTEPHGQASSSSGHRSSSTANPPSRQRNYPGYSSYYQDDQDDQEPPTTAYSTGGARTSSYLSGYPSYSQHQQSPTTAYSTGGGSTSYPSGYPSYSQHQHSLTTSYSENGARANYPSGYSQQALPTVYSGYGASPSRAIYPSVYPQPPSARNYPGYPRHSSTTGYSPSRPSVPNYLSYSSTTPIVSHGGYGGSAPISSYSTATPTVPTVSHGGHGAQVPFSPPVPIDRPLSVQVTGGQFTLSTQYSSGYPQPSPTVGYPSSQPSQDSSDHSSNPRDDFPQSFY